KLVVIIDALDEWAERQAFLEELKQIPSTSPVKFILTSRFDYAIERTLQKCLFKPFPLPPVSQVVLEQYFRFHFEDIDWNGRKPGDRTIARLAAAADGLLIW